MDLSYQIGEVRWDWAMTCYEFLDVLTPVVIVVVVTSAVYTPIRYPHLQRLLQAEGHYGSAGDSHCAAPNFSAIDCA